jgi:hypothetical protein
MRCSLLEVRFRWFVVTLTALIVAVLLAALPAGAKEGVKASLTTSIPLGASPGAQLKVSWRLFFLDQKGQRKPFNASRVFVRLRSAAGGHARSGFAVDGAHPTGEYHATVVVPKGGIGDVEIGLEGWSDANGSIRRSDAIFPITNNPVPGGGGITSPASSGEDSTTWGLLIGTGGLALVAVFGVALVLGRRNRRGRVHPRASRTESHKLTP